MRRWSTVGMWACLVLAGMTWAVPAHAERFAWFKYHEHEGWVEDTGDAVKLRFVPYLLGPDAPPPPGFFNFGETPAYTGGTPEIMPDGRIRLPWRIVRTATVSPQTLDAIAAETHVDRQRLAAAPRTAVEARYRRVVLEIAGREAAVEAYGGQRISGDAAGAFLVDATALPDLRAGNYRLFLEYDHPIADFSALTLDMQVEQLSRTWVQAFREVLRTRSTSGGRFLFFDFSSTVSRTRVRESATSGGLEQGGTSIEIVLRDPTPEQQARVESVLGFAKLTREQMLQRHQAAMATALAAANPELAKAHEKYIEAFSSAAPADSAALVEALKRLGEPEVLQFMAAGFQMSDNQQSGYYRYDYNMAVSQSSTERTRYREYLIRNSEIERRYYAYAEAGGMARALEAALRKVRDDVFGLNTGPAMSSRQWANGVQRALESGNPLWLQYALSDDVRREVQGVDPDLAIDGDGDRLLHLAARRGDAAGAEALVSAGASPRRRNQAGDTPADTAADAGHAALAQRLRALEARRGTVVLAFTHPQGMRMGLRIIAPQGLTGTATRIDPTRLEWRSEDAARLVRLSGAVQVQFSLNYADCQRVRFVAQMAPIPGGCAVVTEIPLQRLVRYPLDAVQRYPLEIRFRDWQTGYEIVSPGN